MPTGREVAEVNTQVAVMFENMEPRALALLFAKITNPDKTFIAISNELWPDLGYARRAQIIKENKVTKVLGMVRSRPWILSMIMANKLGPIMVGVLYELALDPETKSNVRATAAKELIRLAQSTASQLVTNDNEPLPVDEMDSLLASSTHDQELADGLDEDERVIEVEPLSLDDLSND